MKEIFRKIPDGVKLPLFLLWFNVIWVLSFDFLFTYLQLPKDDFMYCILTCLTPVVSFVFYMLSTRKKFNDDDLDGKIAAIEKNVEELKESDKKLVEKLNERFLFIAKNLKYYTQDDTFVLCLDDSKERELEILKTIGVAKNKQSFITPFGLLVLSNGYNLKIVHDGEYGVQVYLVNGMSVLLLFDFSPFDALFYQRNVRLLTESMDLMLSRVSDTFIDFLGAEEHTEVRYSESIVNYKGEEK